MAQPVFPSESKRFPCKQFISWKGHINCSLTGNLDQYGFKLHWFKFIFIFKLILNYFELNVTNINYYILILSHYRLLVTNFGHTEQKIICSWTWHYIEVDHVGNKSLRLILIYLGRWEDSAWSVQVTEHLVTVFPCKNLAWFGCCCEQAWFWLAYFSCSSTKPFNSHQPQVSKKGTVVRLSNNRPFTLLHSENTL